MQLQLSRQPQACTPAGQRLPLAPRDAALVAWLALEGPTPRARLSRLLWPDSAPAAARNALRQRVFQLKRLLGQDVVVGQDTLALAPHIVHDLATGALLLAGEPAAVAGEFETWLHQQREHRSLQAQQHLGQCADAAEAAQDWSTALNHARELLALAPLLEEAHRRLMRLHYLAGDRVAALRAFDRCEKVLKDEVGVRPSAETLELLRTLEQAAPARSPTLTPAQTAAQTQSQTPALLAGAGQRALAPMPVPVSVRRPPRLVGRQEAWQALADARAEGRCAVLTGDGGMGKSRLAGDFALSLGAAVVASARPGDEGSAYASVSRLLRALPHEVVAANAAPVRRELARLLPEWGTAPPPLQGDAERTRFHNALAAVLAHAGAVLPGGLVFDDLHFADAASLELLQYAVAAEPRGWLLTARVAEAPPAVRHWLAQAADQPHLRLLPLLPLTLAQVAELLHSLGLPGLDPARMAPALLAKSGGNPQFLLETLKAWWLQGGPADAGLPLPAAPALHTLIERRIGCLSPRAVQLARCAAIAAPDFSIELAACVLGLRTLDLADPWAELEAAQVLADGAFAHDLVFEAARQSVPRAVARQLHAEVAEFLSAHAGEPARLAHHWTAAARWAQAGPAWVASAQRAQSAGRLVEAAAQLEEAAAAFDQAHQQEARFSALLQRARLLTSGVQGEPARQAVRALCDLAQGPTQALEALEMQLALASSDHEIAKLLALGPGAMAAARQAGRTELEVRFAVLLADALCDDRRATEAVLLLQPHGGWVQGCSDPVLVWDYWCALALALDYADRLRDAMPAWQAAMDLAQRDRLPDLLWKAMANAASTQAKTGRVAEAEVLTARALRLADDLDDTSLRVQQTRVVWGHRLRDLARYGEALAVLEPALQAYAADGGRTPVAGTEHRLSQLFQQLGQPARAQPLLATERPNLPRGLAVMRLVHRADLAHQLGRDGLPLLRQALALLDNPDDVYHRIATLFATRMLPPDEGEPLATSLAAWASARERLGLALAGHVRAAACALAQGAARRALPHAEAALHLAVDRWPDSFYLAELWAVAARAHAENGHADAARRLWQTGADWVRQTAERHVPAPFRDSFLQRNAINAELLARAALGAAT